MNTRLTTCALLLLTSTLGIACDVERTPVNDDSVFRGEDIVPPTDTSGGIIIVKGGHDPDYVIPLEVLMEGYDVAALEWQQVFYQTVIAQGTEQVTKEFLSDEHNYEECPIICEDMHMSWNEGVYVGDAFAEYGDVATKEDETGTLFWVTEAYFEAQVGCGCEY